MPLNMNALRRGKAGSANNGRESAARTFARFHRGRRRKFPRNRRPGMGRHDLAEPDPGRRRFPSFWGPTPKLTRSGRRPWPSYPQYTHVRVLPTLPGLYCARGRLPRQAILRQIADARPCQRAPALRRGSRAASPSIEPELARKRGFAHRSKAGRASSKAAALAHQIGAPADESQAAAVSATAPQRRPGEAREHGDRESITPARGFRGCKYRLRRSEGRKARRTREREQTFIKSPPSTACNRSTRRHLDLAPPP